MGWVRQCEDCQRTIERCNGFVCAGDFVAGRWPPRELCGRCVSVRDLYAIPGLSFISELDDPEGSIYGLGRL